MPKMVQVSEKIVEGLTWPNLVKNSSQLGIKHGSNTCWPFW
jgi:hypothetical protein